MLTRAEMQDRRDTESAFALMNTRTGNDCIEALEKGQSQDDTGVLFTGKYAIGDAGYPGSQRRVKSLWWKVSMTL